MKVSSTGHIVTEVFIEFVDVRLLGHWYLFIDLSFAFFFYKMFNKIEAW